ncbi:hypothetical protein KSP40_PGU009941 [Platanthera guangdongensis]|uniref:H15 domain-containing protein n=1 Tax=Platanthera guangdongensis TaxID=2320717 RepID=A0ABR2M128_9ASPA
MVEVALRALSEEGGSTESSISAYIESTFTDLPWGHDRLLPYYLRKLVISGEISSPTQDHYILSLHHHRLLSSAHSLIGRRGRHPIYLPNPRSHPSFKSPPFASPRRQGRSRVSRFRGKRPEIFAECTPMLHLDQGSAPPRRRRGRPPLQRGGAVGGAIRMSVPRTRRPRGSRISQNGGRGRKPSNNGDCADNPDCFELIHAQSLPGKLHSILPPGPNFSSEILVLSSGKKDLCSETCALQPMQDERREGRRLVASPQPEHGEGQLFAVSVLSEHGEGKFSEVIEVPLLTLEPEMVSYCPSLEHSVHNEGNSSQREAPASTVLQQTEPSEDQASPGEQSTLLSLEKPENDGWCSEIPETTATPEEDHDKCSPGKRTAMVALDQEALVSLLLPGPDEVGSSGASNKKKRSHGKRRRLKLWFEG